MYSRLSAANLRGCGHGNLHHHELYAPCGSPGLTPPPDLHKSTEKRQSCVGLAPANCTEKIKIRARHKIVCPTPAFFSVVTGVLNSLHIAPLPSSPRPPPMTSEPSDVVSPELTDSTLDPKKDSVPRKRSKVSRACDSCRRKKVRCDAEYLAVLLRVTKVCNNCTKNGDYCTFSRVPLKRGPSKGYIRDLVERIDDLVDDAADRENRGDHKHFSVSTISPPYPFPFKHAPPQPPLKLTRPRLKLVDAPPLVGASAPSTGASPAAHTVGTSAPPKPTLHRIPFAGPAGSLSSSLPIILPPLVGPLHPKFNFPPSASLPPAENSERKFSGPLWKVPYEMPNDTDAALAGSENSAALGLAAPSRRSSVDSISSTLTSGSRPHNHSLKPLVSLNSELLVSDSEDDFYPPRARGYSASLSPRNSVSSMLSLNGRMNKQLTLNTPLIQSPQPPHPAGAMLASQPLLHQILPPAPPPPSFPINSLEQNLSIYYTKFHHNLAILPFNEASINRIIAAAQADPSRLLLLFAASLNNLVHYQYVSLENLTSLLHLLLLLYPLEGHPSALSYESLITLFSSLLMVNHTILMSGDVYSLGISLTAAVFNDYKVMQNFRTFVSDLHSPVDPDDLRLHLPRLYLSLLAIDDCHSLSFGCQSILPDHFDLLYSNLEKLVPLSLALSPFVANMEIAKLFHALVISRTNEIFSDGKTNSKLAVKFAPPKLKLPPQGFAALFIGFVKDKVELYEFLSEFSDFLRTLPSGSLDDDTDETISEGQSKIIRLVKKLSQSLLSFANYVSTVCSRLKPTVGTNNDLINPFLNVSYGQSFKLLKTCKVLIDLILTHLGDTELASRFVKVNQDLSIIYNLLVSNLNTNFNAITNVKNEFFRSFRNSVSTPPSFAEQLDLKNLGFVAINIIFKKLETLNLDLSNCPSPASENEELKRSSETWRMELLSSLSSLHDIESGEGWF